MFEDIDKNYIMLEGAYKKIKSLYFYSKDKLYERLKIGEFEEDIEIMDSTLKKLAEYMVSPLEDSSIKYIDILIDKIDYYVFPKSFENNTKKAANNEINNKSITNEINNKNLEKVNFLISLPIELMLLDCIWTLFIGKIAYENKSINSCCFANELQNQKIYNGSENLFNGTDFESNRLFKPYFKQYSNWRNFALDKIEKNYNDKKNTAMLSLDLQTFFYSVNFRFSMLNDLLNKDERLQQFNFLTEIIEKIYIKYTEKIKEVREGITANPSKKETIFPFQMCSTCLLANLFLSKFDEKIEKINGLLYYGRYVDDMILVFNHTCDIKSESSTLIDHYLISDSILENIEDGNYCIPDTNVKINSKKIKTFVFLANEPKTLIEFMKNKMFVNASSINFYDVEIKNERFDAQVYYQENSGGYSKFKDLNILMSDNYRAIQYLYRLINANKNVSEPFNKQNECIFDFYAGTACLEFRSAWVLIFYLGVIQQDKDFIANFHKQVNSEIEKLCKTYIKDIISVYKDKILARIKESLKEELKIALAVALALNSSLEIKKVDIQKMTTTIKKANLFSHYLVSYPLINYTRNADEQGFSLIETDINVITSKVLELDERKLKYSPRFIHFEDINLYYFLKLYKNGGNIFLNDFSEIIEKFESINHINSKFKISSEYREDIGIEYINYKLMDVIETMDIGIASVPIKEENCFEVLQNSKVSLTTSNKQKLFKLLKAAEDNNAKIVVLPEFYLPIAWLSDVSNFAKKSNFTVVCGMQYITYGDRAYNFIVNIQPFYTGFNYRNIFTHIREKYDYSPLEIDELHNRGFEVINSAKDILTVYDMCGQFRYCNRVCYEFTDISSRAKLKNNVELIIVPEFNKDTNYFSNIIESTARDNLCFIAQVNTSIYGDSRITAPYSTQEKNILLVKGGKNDIMIVDNVDIIPLIKFKKELELGKTYDEANKIANAKHEFKKPPARFFEK